MDYVHKRIRSESSLGINRLGPNYSKTQPKHNQLTTLVTIILNMVVSTITIVCQPIELYSSVRALSFSYQFTICQDNTLNKFNLPKEQFKLSDISSQILNSNELHDKRTHLFHSSKFEFMHLFVFLLTIQLFMSFSIYINEKRKKKAIKLIFFSLVQKDCYHGAPLI